MFSCIWNILDHMESYCYAIFYSTPSSCRRECRHVWYGNNFLNEFNLIPVNGFLNDNITFAVEPENRRTECGENVNWCFM